MAKLEVFKKIDEFLFMKIDELQNNPEYQKIADTYSNLEENVQEFIKVSLMLLVTLIPLLVFWIFFSSNSSLKKDLHTREQVIQVSNELIQKKAIMTAQERKILGSSYVDSAGALKNKITSTISMSSIDTSKIRIQNFDSQELDGFITKVKSDISFKDLSSQDIFAILNSLTTRGKMRVDEISVRKSAGDGLLDGMLTVLYYSKEMTAN
jgi:hypothetical protein